MSARKHQFLSYIRHKNGHLRHIDCALCKQANSHYLYRLGGIEGFELVGFLSDSAFSCKY